MTVVHQHVWQVRLPDGNVVKSFEVGCSECAVDPLALLVQAIEALREAIPYIEESTPRSCGACGGPNSNCDMDCVNAATGVDFRFKVQRIIAAYDALSKEVTR